MRDYPLHAALFVRLWAGEAGGIQQAAMGTIAGLSSRRGDDRFDVMPADDGAWLAPYVSPPCYLRAPSSGTTSLMARLRHLAGTAAMRALPGGRPRRSDGTVERSGAEVVHFLTQDAFLTNIPSIYQPWDLQHVHHPDFFTSAERARRDRLYRAYCEAATHVVVASRWVADDVTTWAGLSRERVRVVSPASVLELYPEPTAQQCDDVLAALEVPDRFALYPARPWPHKNHTRLIAAIADLRRRGTDVPVVCTGGASGTTAALRQRAAELGVGDLVRFAGHVGETTLGCLYRRARVLVFPSLFEGWGLPVVEAMSVGLPVVSSNATGLDDLVGSAGITFDPTDVDAIAESIALVWLDDERHATLSRQARREAANYSWTTSARQLRALYRKVAGRTLDGDELELVQQTG